MKLVVTNHAAARWSQRGRGGSLERSIRKARRVGPEMRKLYRTLYNVYLNRRDRVAFIVDERDKTLHVVTVLEYRDHDS